MQTDPRQQKEPTDDNDPQQLSREAVLSLPQGQSSGYVQLVRLYDPTPLVVYAGPATIAIEPLPAGTKRQGAYRAVPDGAMVVRVIEHEWPEYTTHEDLDTNGTFIVEDYQLILFATPSGAMPESRVSGSTGVSTRGVALDALGTDAIRLRLDAITEETRGHHRAIGEHEEAINLLDQERETLMRELGRRAATDPAALDEAINRLFQ